MDVKASSQALSVGESEFITQQIVINYSRSISAQKEGGLCEVGPFLARLWEGFFFGGGGGQFLSTDYLFKRSKNKQF